tara:strand:- start:21 stop:1004 length:984 start_codon:yes stop_codon:yes gene_type:complete
MTEDTSPENLRKFLESDDSAMRRMGLSMAKGSGIPEELNYHVLAMTKWDSEEENRKVAKELAQTIKLEDLNTKNEFTDWNDEHRTKTVESAIIQFPKNWDKIYNDVREDRVSVMSGFWDFGGEGIKRYEIMKKMFNFQSEERINMHDDDVNYYFETCINNEPDILFDYEGLLEALMDLYLLERYWPAERSLETFFHYVYSYEPYEMLPFQYIAKDKGSLLFQSIYIHCHDNFTPNELKKVLEEFEEFHKTNKSVIQSYHYYSSDLLSDAPLEILQNNPPDDELAVADLIRTLGNIGNKKAIEEITLYLENDHEKIRTAAKEALEKLE